MPKRLSLIIGAVLAVLAVVMVKVYMDQQRAAVIKQAQLEIEKSRKNQTTVLVAKKNIPKGTMIEEAMLGQKIMPIEFAQPGALTSADSIVGKAAVIDIAVDEQITKNKVLPMRDVKVGGTAGLPQQIPPGKRAVTVPVDVLTSVGGMIKPYDYVDVIATLRIPVQTPDGKQSSQLTTVPIFQNVLVLAVGQDIGSPAQEKGKGGRYYEKEETKKELAATITLALTPHEANLISFVLEQKATLRMVLRSPIDPQVQEVTLSGWESLISYIPQPPRPDQGPGKVEPPPRRKVEVWRGTTLEDVYLSGKPE